MPAFRFHPGAYTRGSFIASDKACDVCGRASIWLYASSIYVDGDEPDVCARCIHDGRLAAHLDHDFQMHDAELGGDTTGDLADEVMQRTPGFSTFNAFAWPVLDGKPLAYVGHGDEDALWDDPAAVDAIRAMYEESGETLEGRTPYALVFREVDGDRYLAIIDLD